MRTHVFGSYQRAKRPQRDPISPAPQQSPTHYLLEVSSGSIPCTASIRPDIGASGKFIVIFRASRGNHPTSEHDLSLEGVFDWVQRRIACTLTHKQRDDVIAWAQEHRLM
jgi:hypothetical protein